MSIIDPTVSRSRETRTYVEPARGTPTAEIDQKTQQVAQEALKSSRPLHAGSLEGLLVNQSMAGTLGATRDVVELFTKEHPSHIDASNLAHGLLTVPVGLLQGQRGLHTLKSASAQGDDVGVRVGFLRITRLFSDVIRGLSKVATGGLQIASTIAPHSSAMQNVSKLNVVQSLGYVTAAGSGVTALAVGCFCTTYLAETLTISGALRKKIEQDGPQMGYAHLREMLTLTKEDKKDVLDYLLGLKAVPSYRKLAGMIAKKVFGSEAEEEIEQIDKKALAKTKGNRELLSKLIESNYSEYDDPLLDGGHGGQGEIDPDVRECITTILGADHGVTPGKIEQFLEHLTRVYEKACLQEKSRKESVFERTVGKEAKALIHLHQEQEIQNIPQEVVTATIKSAQSSLRDRTILLSIGLFSSVLWTGLNIMTQVVTGGAYGIAEAVLGLVVCLIGLGVDSYILYQEYKATHVLSKDKLFMFLTTLVTAAAGAAVTALAHSLASQVITGVLTFVWLGIFLYMLYQWQRGPAHAPMATTTPGDSGIEIDSEASSQATSRVSSPVPSERERLLQPA